MTRPTCHPQREHRARGLCISCYELARGAGRLDQHPCTRIRRSAADFVADYELLRSEGYTQRHIAERLGMKFPAVQRAYLRAVAAGMLTPDRRTS